MDEYDIDEIVRDVASAVHTVNAFVLARLGERVTDLVIAEFTLVYREFLLTISRAAEAGMGVDHLAGELAASCALPPELGARSGEWLHARLPAVRRMLTTLEQCQAQGAWA